VQALYTLPTLGPLFLYLDVTLLFVAVAQCTASSLVCRRRPVATKTETTFLLVMTSSVGLAGTTLSRHDDYS
jgi:hypothetical protein